MNAWKENVKLSKPPLCNANSQLRWKSPKGRLTIGKNEIFLSRAIAS
jgi:hypothetical protein